MGKIKVIALCGKSASGKDTICKNLVHMTENTNLVVSYTTRPKRYNEIDGIDYHFITDEEMLKMIQENKVIEAATFNGWTYATANLDKDNINIGVFNIDGICALQSLSDIDLAVYLISATDKTRLIRALSRERTPDIEEIFRRYKTDNEDFADMDTYVYEYVTLDNEIEEDFYNCIDFIAADNNLKFNNHKKH